MLTCVILCINLKNGNTVQYCLQYLYRLDLEHLTNEEKGLLFTNHYSCFDSELFGPIKILFSELADQSLVMFWFWTFGPIKILFSELADQSWVLVWFRTYGSMRILVQSCWPMMIPDLFHNLWTNKDSCFRAGWQILISYIDSELIDQ